MSSNRTAPDYDLEDVRVVTGLAELKAMSHPLRDTLLDLVLERAASVNELAKAVRKPPSTVAFHVGVLVDADLFTVVRTRKVRAIEERYYGRTARTFYVGRAQPDDVAVLGNPLVEAASESAAAHQDDELRALHRHARVPEDRIAEFWERVLELANEFGGMPRRGDTTHAFVAGLYPTDFPSLPEPHDDA